MLLWIIVLPVYSIKVTTSKCTQNMDHYTNKILLLSYLTTLACILNKIQMFAQNGQTFHFRFALSWLWKIEKDYQGFRNKFLARLILESNVAFSKFILNAVYNNTMGTFL